MSAQSDYERYARELQALRKQIADQSAVVGRARSDESNARLAASRSNSPSTIKSKNADALRYGERAASAEKKRADLEGKAAAKERSMNDARGKADKARAQVEARQDRDRQAAMRNLETRLASSNAISARSAVAYVDGQFTAADDPPFDLFISHASEDKDSIARPLYEALTALGLRVWFDEAELHVGDSLRRKIDAGLASSRFGVVIFSHAFFAKQWPQAELDGLFARQIAEGRTVILPIWHNISKDEMLEVAPTLVDSVALQSSTMSVEEIARELYRVARPGESGA